MHPVEACTEARGHPPPPAREQRVAAEEQPVVGCEQADRSFGVTWRVEHAQPDLPEPNLAALSQLDSWHRRRNLERRPDRLGIRQPVPVERMDGDRRARVLRDRRVVADVIPVAVGRHDELERPRSRRQLVRDPGETRRRGVDRDRLLRPRIGEDMDVRRDRADDARETVHAQRPPFRAEARRSRRPTRAAASRTNRAKVPSSSSGDRIEMRWRKRPLP